MYDYVVACKGLRSQIRKMEAIEDNDSRPRKPVRFEVGCKKEPREVRNLEGPQANARSQWRKSTSSGRQRARCQTCDQQKNGKKGEAVREGAQERRSQTAREGTQVHLNQTVTEGTQAPVRKVTSMMKGFKRTRRTFSTSWRKDDSVGAKWKE